MIYKKCVFVSLVLWFCGVQAFAQTPPQTWAPLSTATDCFSPTNPTSFNATTAQPENPPCQSYNNETYENWNPLVEGAADIDIQTFSAGVAGGFQLYQFDMRGNWNATNSGEAHKYYALLDFDRDSVGGDARPDFYMRYEPQAIHSSGTTQATSTWVAEGNVKVQLYQDVNNDLGCTNPLTADFPSTGGACSDGFTDQLSINLDGAYVRIYQDKLEVALRSSVFGNPTIVRAKPYTTQTGTISPDKAYWHDENAISDLTTFLFDNMFNADSNTWLLITNTPTVSKAFSPASVNPGGTSVLTITLVNPNTTIATLNAPLIDTLPSGLVIVAPAPTTTCTGSGVLTNTTTSVTLPTGRIIPAGTVSTPGTCTITLTAQGNTSGSYLNTIPAGNGVGGTTPATNGGLSTDLGQGGAATDTLTVNNVLQTPTLTKTFNPTHIGSGQVSILTISLGNSNTSAINLTQALVDNLPTNTSIAVPTGLTTTCGGVPTTTTTSVTLPNTSTIPVGGCIITVNVTSSTLGVFTNIIPAGIFANGLNTTAGAAPSASAPLVILEPAKTVRLLTDADTSTAPSIGDVIQYQIIYALPIGAPNITNFQIFDILPSQVNPVPTGGANVAINVGVGSTATENTAYTGVAGASTSSLLGTGANLAANSSITITIDATINNTVTLGTPFNNTARASGTGLSVVSGNGTAGGLATDADATPFGVPATALPQPNDTGVTGEPTQVTPVAPNADISVAKSQPSPAIVNSGGTITYTITVTNNGPATAMNVVVTDTLPTGITFQSATGGGTHSAGVVTWNGTTTPALSSLANGASQVFTVVVNAP
jgi:uncharacterized repeat protein (TIGR01451 family)/fimbrial isopeptide formation D2 family protein